MSMPDTTSPPAVQPPAVGPDDTTEEAVAAGHAGGSASDIVETWGLGSFPASDPPSNW